MKTKSEIGLIILAAGASRRLGAPKQLLKFRGETLLRRIAREAHESTSRPIVAVFGYEAAKFTNELNGLDISVAENSDWEKGMGTSIKVGLEKLLELKKSLDGALVTVCDQPFVTVATINDLVETREKNRALIVASEYEKTLGVPALFDAKIFDCLRNLESGGAKQIIERFRAETIGLPFLGGAFDIDTMDDYERLVDKRSLSTN